MRPLPDDVQVLLRNTLELAKLRSENSTHENDYTEAIAALDSLNKVEAYLQPLPEAVVAANLTAEDSIRIEDYLVIDMRSDGRWIVCTNDPGHEYQEGAQATLAKWKNLLSYQKVETSDAEETLRLSRALDLARSSNAAALDLVEDYRDAESKTNKVVRNDPISALAIRYLVQNGAVTQEAADSAFTAACEAAEEAAERLNQTLPWVKRNVSSKLTVWFDAMPESNGKRNWTVMVCPLVNGLPDQVDGYTIMRSEYHGRSQYTADYFRWLLGETQHRPCPTEYDENSKEPFITPLLNHKK